MTYRVICSPAGKGLFDYHVAGLPPGRAAQGRSREPLLDACRQLKRMGADPAALCGLFHKGSTVWAMRCPIGQGAELYVSEGYFKKLPEEHNA